MYSGNYKDVISNLVKKYDIQAVYWNRSYDPYSINRDKDLKLYLENKNIEVKTFNSTFYYGNLG